MPGNNECVRKTDKMQYRKEDREGLTVRSLQDRDKEREATGDEEGHPVKLRFRGRQEDRMTKQ